MTARAGNSCKSRSWLAILFVAVVALSGCNPTDTTSDFEVPPGKSGETQVFVPGRLVWVPSTSIVLSGAGQATLVSVDPLGLPANVQFQAFVSRVLVANQELGLFPDDAVPQEVRDAARPLAGDTISAADGPFQAIVVLVVPEAGIAVHGYRLHYERDGQPRTVFIASSSHVCTTGAPADCSFIDAQP